MNPAFSDLPCAAGIGLRSPHVKEVWQTRPDVAWWEVHSENYFEGGTNLAVLTGLRQDYPISLHGVGMGLGSLTPLDQTHLRQLTQLVRQIEPAVVSEHLCWNRTAEGYLPDLLPVPYTQEALALLCERVDQVQTALGRPILIENVSAYVRFAWHTMDEAGMLAELSRRTGCGILLDINNVYVNAVNLGISPGDFLAALPAPAIGEIHIAGHSQADGFLLDTHDAPVIEPVWQLLAEAYQRFGPVPTLLERDGNIPALAELRQEADRVEAALQQAWLQQTRAQEAGHEDAR
ncbi:MNIO family bufferin maturase [Leeia oryzae]|uniref:MNIO family bufferin maturase n=1 Tax=Leeia oryzae TaxID=356662 RepID=UPI00037B0C27|nr:DUF692 domain-containing protein [Leeia oryzae]